MPQKPWDGFVLLTVMFFQMRSLFHGFIGLV